MTAICTFTNGPAATKTLTLGRGPIMLRVVVAADGGVDALDQHDDVAKPGERIFVYVCSHQPSMCYIDFVRGCRRCGERRSLNSYELCQVQPDDAVLRDNAAWVAWCNAIPTEQIEAWAPWTKGKVQR